MKALPANPEFNNFVNLLAILAATNAELKAIESDINKDWIGIVDGVREEYAELQATTTRTEAALEVILRAHPEWLPARKKSIKTPYGDAGFRSSTELNVANPELSIVLIKQDPEAASLYVRTEEVLDLEALEKLTDAELAHYKITRVTKDNFFAKPASVDLGKAIKERTAK